MSGMNLSVSTIRNLFSVVALLVLTTPVLSQTGDSSFLLRHVLSKTEVILLEDTGSQCFETYIPATGILVLEVSVPDPGSAEPRIYFLGASEESAEPDERSFRSLETWATSLLVEIKEPGDHRFCIDAQNPETTLGSVKLSSAFGSLLPAATKGGDPDEDEEEPDTIRYMASELCGRAMADDHSDLFRCASPIRSKGEVEAEVGNASGADEDVFVLVVDDLITLRIESTGEVATSIRLYDRTGQQLKIDPEETPAGSYFFETLSSGAYFLRVSARYGEEGRYRLSAKVPAR